MWSHGKVLRMEVCPLTSTLTVAGAMRAFLSRASCVEAAMSEPQVPRVEHRSRGLLGVRLDPVFLQVNLG